MPSEDIPIGPKEADEHVFLFWTKLRADDHRLGRITGVQVDGLGDNFTGRFHLRNCRLLRGDFRIFVRELAGEREDFFLSDVGGRLYSEINSLLVTCVGPSEITPKGKYSVRPGHL